MYKFIVETNSVIRISDNKVIAPCQSADDPDFVEYNNWVLAGNQPQMIQPTSSVVLEYIITPLEFKERFTPTELLSFITAAETDAVCKLLLLEAQVSSEVVLNSAETIGGVNYLVTLGIITPQHAQDILKPKEI